MNIVNTGGHSVAEFEIDSGDGDRHFDSSKCPVGLRGPVEKGIKRGQSSGTIAGAGRLWGWHVVPVETVMIEFTQDDVVVESFEVSESAWRAFEALAQRRNVDARSWLTCLLADALSRDVSLNEMLRWLFQQSPEIGIFEAAQRQYHRVE